MNDYQAFLQRLSTFRPSTWCGHPIEASPLVCARYGWKNIDFNILQCEDCQVIFPFIQRTALDDPSQSDKDYYEDLFSSHHQSSCLWRNQCCPSSFLKLQLSPMDSALNEFLKTFDSLEALWDLPVMQDPLQVDSSRVERLVKFLERRQMSKFAEAMVLAVQKELKSRWEAQMIIGLLGWELKWDLHFVFLKEPNQIPPQFSLGFENDPQKTKVCFGRQSYLNCSLCNAKIGLWSVQTSAQIEIYTFHNLMKHKKASKETSSIGMKRAREEMESVETPSVNSCFLTKSPVFGMKKFAKKKLPEIKKTVCGATQGEVIKKDSLQTDFSSCYPVHNESTFNPVEAHRFFCPYRTDWKKLLEILTRENFT